MIYYYFSKNERRFKMRTVKERAKLDARFSRASKATRWLYRHHLIPKVVKVTIQDFIDNRWSESCN